IVLELVAEAGGRGRVRRPLVEHAAAQAYDRPVVDEVLGEQFLAVIGCEMGKTHAAVRQHQVTLAQLGKVQQLQRFAEMEYLVRLELQMAGENRQVGVPVIRRSRQVLDQARKLVGGDMVEDQA